MIFEISNPIEKFDIWYIFVAQPAQCCIYATGEKYEKSRSKNSEKILG